MDDDFGSPEAVAVLFDLAGEVNRSRSPQLAGVLKALGACLGLLQQAPEKYLQTRLPASAQALALGTATPIAEFGPEQIDSLIAERAQAKAARNFAEADRIRQDLLERGIVLKDSPAGTSWESKA